jgi:hypothetical protein
MLQFHFQNKYNKRSIRAITKPSSSSSRHVINALITGDSVPGRKHSKVSVTINERRETKLK